MSSKFFSLLSWNISRPLSTMRVYSKQDKKISVKDVLEKKLPIKSGDRVVILRYCPQSCSKKSKELPVLTMPIRGTTVGAVMKALDKGLKRPLKPGDRGKGGKPKVGSFFFEPSRQKHPFPEKNEVVYSKISGYFDSSARSKLVKKYEGGRLKPYELYGDHLHFEVMERRGKYWYFYTGS